MSELAHPDREAKVRALREAGTDPYPARGVDARPIAELLAGAGTAEAPGPLVGTTVTAAGRLLSLRDFGKLVFAPLLDRTGRIQIGLQRDRLSEWWPQRKLLDGGDLIGVEGELGHTQKGEPTLWARSVRMLAKAVAPPPEKWHGLSDVETRYRRRYVDLWASEGVAAVFEKRSRILRGVRRFLDERGYIEVETPVLQPLFGGAAARPFVTHYNALDAEFFLRIAPELYLKRLVVGGLERVYEIARNFRNEGLSTRHNPEFSMLELYEAQADYRRMMEIVERLFELSARAVNGTTKVSFRGTEYDLAAPYPRKSYIELFRSANGCEFDDEPAVRRRAKELGLDTAAERWKLMNDVFEATVEDSLTGPVFVVDYPVPICPLATKDPEAPGQVDWDYVQALEYGMPPAGGLGIGIDRLVMVLTGQDSIRDVLLFPAMRPLAAAAAAAAEGEAEA